MFKKIYGPLSLQWEVIPECNYRCIHCYNYWRRYDEKVEKNCDCNDKIIDEVISSKANVLTITGGEPLLVFDKITYYMDKLITNGVKVNINTNASYLSDKIAKYLHKNNIGILVSLPCYIPEINDQITGCSGSFVATTNGIKTALKYGVRVNTNMVVTRINQQYVFKTAKFLKDEFGLKVFNATKAGKPINATEEYGKYEVGLIDLRKLFDDLVKVKNELGMEVDSLSAYPQCSYVTQESFQLIGSRRTCSAGRTSAAIGYDNSVKACPRDQQTYGNLEEDTLIDCWNKMSDWRDHTFLPKNCELCFRKDLCAGGCRVEAFSIESSLKANDPCADLNNLPVKFQYLPKVAEFNDIDVFVVNKNFKVMEEKIDEKRGYRITINSQSRFITDELYNFIQDYSEKAFSNADLQNYFSIEKNLANELLVFLNKSGLIVLI